MYMQSRPSAIYSLMQKSEPFETKPELQCLLRRALSLEWEISFIWQEAVHFSVLPGGWVGAGFSTGPASGGECQHR